MKQEEIEYNQYLKDNITHYLVTTFLGRGKYEKIRLRDGSWSLIQKKCGSSI